MVGRKSPKSLYSMKHVTFEDDAGRLRPARRRGLHQAERAAPAPARDGAGWPEEVGSCSVRTASLRLAHELERAGGSRSGADELLRSSLHPRRLRRRGLAGLDDGVLARHAPAAAGRALPANRVPIPAPMPSPPARAPCAARCSSAPPTRCCPACMRWASPWSAASPARSWPIEAFKRFTGVTGSTGIVFAAPFAATVAVGRLGCFFSGLADFTYGTPTGAALGRRFRRRHRAPSGAALRIARAWPAMFVVLIQRFARTRPLLAGQRLLSHGRLVRPAALRLGVLQALCNAARAVQPVPFGLSRPRPVRCRDDPQRGSRRMYDGVARKSAPYLFLGQTTSLCETCLGLVPAKIIEEDGGIYYSKRCPEHGVMKTLVSDDPVYWRRTLEYLKPGDRPLAPHTRTERGCPWDCGLCPDHEQHSLPGDRRDQRGLQPRLPGVLRRFLAQAQQPSQPRPRSSACSMPWWRARASPTWCRSRAASPPSIRRSSTILAAARRRPIKHVMLNTNGIRIAEDPAFCDALAELQAGLRGLSAVRFAERRGAEEPARRGAHAHPPPGAGQARGAQHLDDAGLHGEARRQRRRDRRDRAPCAEVQVRARRQLPAGPGCRPQRGLRSQDATASCCRRSAAASSRTRASSPTAT